MKKILLFLILTILSSTTASSENSFLPFLNQAISARAYSMGTLSGVLSDGANTIYANPAGLSALTGAELNYSFFNNLPGQTFASYSYAKKGFGLGYLKYDEEKMESASLTTISISADGYISEHWGINYKFINDTISSTDTIEAQAYDIGIAYKFFGNYMAGIYSQNISSPVKLRNGRKILPRATIAGIGYKTQKISLGIDNIFEEDGTIKTNYGMEMALTDSILLRAGYKDGEENEKISYGIGIAINKLRFDYGVDLPDKSDRLQKISLSIKFG
ncbi:MAG: hypothetical protein A3J83_02435 [Elusimicrobia bacterium RIFOXYA2_FULL_40_6]|nr:MAG: hypothetical protein A3J83_02435 [Elusimicrobia bacterium RIFOXYA2_FULL_40_6]